MERVPGAKALIRELARVIANLEIEIVVPRAGALRKPAGNRAGQKAKAQAPVKGEKNGKAAESRPKYL
jgi:hypothetical protein